MRTDPVGGGRGSRRPGRFILLGALLLLPSCSPVYVIQAGIAEWKILSGRRPLEEVIGDPATDPGTRAKLLLAREARNFAVHILGLEAGDAYTTYSQLDTEVLAWVLSAAYRDRLEARTWWFPVVGRVPYRGYASRSSAEKAQRKLEAAGLDTYLRPTSAFSTLGWFSDPILSTFLRHDEVDLVDTVIHELAHSHLWVPGQVRFNESFATFVGRVGAIRFYCGPGQIPSPSRECAQARDRWEADKAFSRFLDGFVGELEAIYARPGLDTQGKTEARDQLFRSHQERYQEIPPSPGPDLIQGFLGRPPNNAVLLARMRYYHRLPGFQALLEEHGGELREVVAALKEDARGVPDPFQHLPRTP